MRKRFSSVVGDILDSDPFAVVVLGDIGVHSFSRTSTRHPARVINIGILEQSMIGVAAGLAASGIIPIVHTIAPFLVERAFEQLKIDFGYQGLGGNFVSVGASYDYSALGCTHHCPGDVPLLLQIPGMEIIVPGTADEFDTLFLEAYSNGNPTYFRLSEKVNALSRQVRVGKVNRIRQGEGACIVVVGPYLDEVLEAADGLDVEVVYVTTIRPFDNDFFAAIDLDKPLLIVEPYYSGPVIDSMLECKIRLPSLTKAMGVPRRFLKKYGKSREHDYEVGLSSTKIREFIISALDA